MTAFREVRKILLRYSKELQRAIPREYEDLMTSYCRGHSEPCEKKQRKDLKYLNEKLGID